ncbi:MAG: 50S ribosomal protein L29 [Deltaproteobacteria bacterium]|nr:MAG: 50S ribosomal protein L29 [Deltaproteobacteria bacterium]
MKTATLREQTDEELRNMESDLARELWQARFDNHTNQLDNTSKIPKLRRQIATVKTLLTERKNASEQG